MSTPRKLSLIGLGIVGTAGAVWLFLAVQILWLMMQILFSLIGVSLGFGDLIDRGIR